MSLHVCCIVATHCDYQFETDSIQNKYILTRKFKQKKSEKPQIRICLPFFFSLKTLPMNVKFFFKNTISNQSATSQNPKWNKHFSG